jgi:hypothetical protein
MNWWRWCPLSMSQAAAMGRKVPAARRNQVCSAWQMLGDRQRHPWAAAISWQSVARTADRSNEAIRSRTRDKNASNHNQHYLYPRLPPATSEGAPLYLDRSTDVSAQWRTITMTRAHHDRNCMLQLTNATRCGSQTSEIVWELLRGRPLPFSHESLDQVVDSQLRKAGFSSPTDLL